MEKRNIWIFLIIVCAIGILLRLYFAFSTPYFSDDTSYYYLRHIEVIKETAVPQFYDPLSFGGRFFIFSPLFHYIFALLTYFGSTWYLTKIIPNLFAATLSVIIFFLTQYITRNNSIALFTACIATFIPIYFVETVNALTITSLSLPLAFLFLFSFYKLQEGKWKWLSIFLLVSFVILDPVALLILFGLILSLFLEKIYSFQPKKEWCEFLFFGLLLSLWFYMLLYKQALIELGIQILWQNIPPQLIDKYYYNITIISSIYHIGIVPLIFGLVVIYYILFVSFKHRDIDIEELKVYKLYKEQQKKIFPVIGITIVITLFLVFEAIEFSIGLAYLSVLLVILSGYGYMLFHNYLQKTKIHNWSNLLFGIIFLIFIGSSVIPTIYYTNQKIQQTITPKEVAFLYFLPEIVREEEIVLSLVDDGHYVEYFGRRKAMADSNFLQIKDAKQRLEDIQTLFTTQSKIIATKIMNKYNADYIYISPTAKKLYGIEYLPYEDNDCFRLVYTGDVRLYKSTCSGNKG